MTWSSASFTGSAATAAGSDAVTFASEGAGAAATSITARNAAWREAADLRVALDKVRAQRDAAQSGGPSDERKPCGCTMGARWITVKHCGGHAFPADERLGGGR